MFECLGIIFYIRPLLNRVLNSHEYDDSEDGNINRIKTSPTFEAIPQ